MANTLPLWEQIFTDSFSFYEFKRISNLLCGQTDLIVGLIVHKEIQISILVQILHVHAVNTCLRNFSVGRKDFSKTDPVMIFLYLVLTKAAPFPGFTC